jgi:hypothetical protein
VIKKERKERIQILKKPKVAEGFGSGESVYKKMIDRIVRVTVFHRPGMYVKHTHQCQVTGGSWLSVLSEDMSSGVYII